MKKENEDFLYQSDLKEIEEALANEAELSKKYFNDTVKDLTRVDRKHIVATYAQNKSYRIPFKVKWGRFKNKLSKIFG